MTDTKKNTALAPATSAGLKLETMEEMGLFAQAAMKSGFFRDMKEAAAGVIKVQWGLELGVGPVTALTGIHNIQGKLAMSATLMASLIQRHPRYKYVTRMDDQSVTLQCYVDGEFVGASTFSMEDAKKAGVLGNPTWKKYPRNMMFARALSNAARWYFADVFSGAPAYTTEELGDESEPAEEELHIAEVRDEVVKVEIVDEEPMSVAEVKEAEAQETVDTEDTLTAGVYTMPASEAPTLEVYLRALRAAGEDPEAVDAAMQEHGPKLKAFSVAARDIARCEYALTMATARGDMGKIEKMQGMSQYAEAWEAADVLLGEGA